MTILCFFLTDFLSTTSFLDMMKDDILFNYLFPKGDKNYVTYIIIEHFFESMLIFSILYFSFNSKEILPDFTNSFNLLIL